MDAYLQPVVEELQDLANTGGLTSRDGTVQDVHYGPLGGLVVCATRSKS